MSGTQDRAGLSLDEKRALLARLTRPATYPLSFAQERLWFLDQLSPGTPFYNIATAVPLRMAIDPTALEQAVNTVVARHEALRTTFPTHEGRPIQAITPTLHIPLTIHDLRPLPTTDRTPEAERLAAQEAGRPFDLTTGPLLRTGLIQLGPTDTVLLLTFHHIVADGWSLGVFARELWTAYTAHATGRPPQLPALPIQYADFAVWQRHWLTGDVLDRQLAYWRTQLDNLPALQLPTDHPRPPFQTFRGATTPVRVAAAVTRRLKELGGREGCTPFMTVLAVFQTLLARYTGQDEMVVGTYIAGRTRAETEGLIGFFINTLAMRGDLRGNPTFRQLLGRVRNVALGAYANQDIPFPKLVQELHPERDLSRNPIFQVVCHLYNAPGAGEATSSALSATPGGAAFDLVLDLLETPAGLEGRFQFSTDLFETATVERLARHFESLLASAVEAPDQQIWDLPLTTGAERRRLLVENNETRVPYPPEPGVVALLDEQVAATPDAPAFITPDETLTYRELDRRSSELATKLRALGVGPEIIVGVRLERSLSLAVALMAVFKAGGAYLPLDPAHPAERLERLIDDAPAAVVVTPDGLVATAAAPPATAPVRQASDDLAYVIYTSGSTGPPKGVAVQHDQILNRLHWMWASYPFAPGEVSCAKTPPTFVDSLWELLGPLLRGVPTLILPTDRLKDTFALVDALADAGVTRIWLVPSLLRAILDAYPDLGERLPRLRFWVSSGEALDLELYERFRSTMPHADLYNLYGTSEAWDVTWYDPQREAPPIGRVPIGRPIWNMRCYVLDRRGRPVPQGVVGDLHVGGIGLARGYLHRPELTAATFGPDPFSPVPGARMYRTGDLARYRADGTIEYIGRADHQVKLRGYRIELGEIEALLREHPAVRDAAALLRHDLPADPRLVAYIVLRSAADTTQNGSSVVPQLRKFLTGKLPDYAVPSVFVVLDALPLTVSGKTDRFALPPPGTARPQLERRYTAPATAAERVMVGIWQDVLGTQEIGVDDDFFADLGGHSLLATQIVARARDTFAVELPLTRLFEEPSVRGLVGALLDDPGSGGRIERVAQLLLDVSELSEQDVKAMLARRAEA